MLPAGDQLCGVVLESVCFGHRGVQSTANRGTTNALWAEYPKNFIPGLKVLKKVFSQETLHKTKMCVSVWEGNWAKIAMQWNMSKKGWGGRGWKEEGGGGKNKLSVDKRIKNHGKYSHNHAKEKEIHCWVLHFSQKCNQHFAEFMQKYGCLGEYVFWGDSYQLNKGN